MEHTAVSTAQSPRPRASPLASHASLLACSSTRFHHQDLRAPTPLDPPELTVVREKEEALIRSWIGDASRA
eukprot:7276882-Prymnesium_polylepis.1